MDNRERREVLDALEWQLILGLIAGWIMMILKVFGVALLVAGMAGPHADFGPLLTESIACGALMNRFQRRHLYAPIILLGIWAVGYWTAWSGAEAPPLFYSLGSLAIGVGLCVGINALVRLRSHAPLFDPPAT
jgi:hypothetical protein